MKIKIKRITGIHRKKYSIKDFECPLTDIKLSGENGAGKSLLLKWIWKHSNCIVGVEHINIRYLSQNPQLFFEESIEFNLNILIKNNDSHDVWEAFSSHYPKIELTETCKNLSGGQCQLLYILIFFSQHSDIYLIDEPFSNLDFEVIKTIEKLIYELEGVKIIVSHDLRFSNYLELKLVEGNLCIQ